jgi:hypothetical protein
MNNIKLNEESNTEKVDIINMDEVDIINTEKVDIINMDEVDIINTEKVDIINMDEVDIINTEKVDIINMDEVDIINTEKVDIINMDEVDIINTEKVDIYLNTQIEEENEIFKKYSKIFFSISSIFIFFSGIILITLTIIYDTIDRQHFWINQFLKYLLISIVQVLAALLVIKYNVKVNYTRKLVHISYFIFPQILDKLFLDFKKNFYTECWNIWIILVLLVVLAKPIRSRIKIVETMFKAVDRPEDRPYTLLWLATQTIATLFVIIPFALYFSSIGKTEWVFIPILINGLADGLAEPVGVRFGKHKYQTRSCCSSRLYTRSYEGSFCVYIVSLIIILSFYYFFTFKEYIFNSILIPILITFTEAYSPHTWDCPFIFFVVCGLLSLSNLL